MRTYPLTRLLCLLVPVALIFSSCQKEISGEEVLTPKCRLEKITYYDDTGAFSDSASFVYNSSNKVTRANTAGGYYNLYNYKNDKISSVDYYQDQQGYLRFFDSVVYDGSGRIKNVLFYTDLPGFNLAYAGYDITYNVANVPEKIIQKVLDTTSGNLVDAYQYDYTYTSGNITRLIFTEVASSLKDTITYTYDSNPNYFQKLSTDFGLLDMYLTGATGQYYGDFGALVFSRNNVTAINSLPVTYQKDAQGNLTELLIDGDRQASYTMKCQ
jgi:hypothetical protein